MRSLNRESFRISPNPIFETRSVYNKLFVHFRESEAKRGRLIKAQCHQIKEFFINRLKKAANAAKACSHRREPVVTSKSIMSRDNGDRIEHLEFLSPLSRLHV